MVDHTDEVEEGDASGQAGERVAKALARAGVASRRDVERLIGEGRVRLNGRLLDTPAVKVGPGDVLTVDGAVVGEAEGTRVWRYHKPVGLITAHKDPGGRPTVFERLPAGLPRVISVGRLDLNSEGLLLLTNDGALARALELPATGWVRRYRARAHGRTDQATLDRLKDGVTIEGVRYGPIEARLDKAKEGATGSNLWITVSLAEGKNREVRRVLESLELKVNRLIRLAYGPFQLGTLALGDVEEVGPRVIQEQLSGVLPGLRTARAGAAGPRVAAQPAAMPAAPVPRRGNYGVPAEARAAASEPAAAAPTPASRSGALIPLPAEKKAYKPGWAKPKKRPGPPRTAKPAKARTERGGTDLTFKAKPKPAAAASASAGPNARSARPATPKRRSPAPGTRTPSKAD